MTDPRRTAPRASSVSRQISGGWSMWVYDANGYTTRYPFPIVSQMGEGVLVEGEPDSLGWAASILVQRGGYVVIHGGQWIEDEDGFDHWNGWLEVRRATA